MNNDNFGSVSLQKKKKKKFYIIPFVISVLVSFLLWNYVMMVESPTRQVTFESIPISIVKGDNSLAVISGASTTVNLTVSGKKSLTASLTKDNFKITADISDLTKYSTAGEYSNIPLKIELPDEISLVSQSAETVTLYLDNKEVKTFPLEVDFPGSRTFEGGCELAADMVELSNSEVNVTGPSSVISKISKAVVIIPIEGEVTSSKTFSGTPVLIDSYGGEVINPYLSMDVSTVTGKVPVYMTKEVKLCVDFKNGFFNEDNVQVKINPESVSVRGEIEKVRNIDSINVTTVDEKKFTPEFTASLPELEGISVLAAADTVSISISAPSYSEKTLIVNNISVNNPNNLSYSVPEGGISVSVMGEKSSIAEIKSEDVFAVVDLGGISSLGNGAQNAPVTIVFSDKYASTCFERGEYTVLVSQAK